MSKKLFALDGLTKEKVIKEFRERCVKAGDSMDLVGDSGVVWGVVLSL